MVVIIEDVQELVVLVAVHIELVELLGEHDVLIGGQGVAELGGTELVVVLELHLQVGQEAGDASEVVGIGVETLVRTPNGGIVLLVMARDDQLVDGESALKSVNRLGGCRTGPRPSGSTSETADFCFSCQTS